MAVHKAKDAIATQHAAAHNQEHAQAANGQAGALAQAALIAILLMLGTAAATPRQQHAAAQTTMLLQNTGIMAALAAHAPIL